ncbi:hypothetical protein GZ206_01775 [Dermatophilus congolensis]|uniref:nucleotidyltransferase domain-containing protein n=1 Tax=Dermatophilus congolensis TaxID=1863 RepID=UPI001AB0344C|nr:hypothetical protein [Dermatophilus congolensis]MBO3166984.1 hypothetical protein [Dermatophilus congolensis]
MDPFELDDVAQADLYGPWVSRSPGDVAELFRGYLGSWWISGGWAVEAFTGVSRKHVDLDVYVLRSQLKSLRVQLSGRQHVWAVSPGGALYPIAPEKNPEGSAEEVLPEGTRDVWTRRNGRQPWEFDIALSESSQEEWVYQHDGSVRRPMSEALWEKDGVFYVQPEMAFLSKARTMTPRDVSDFEVVLPLLSDDRRAWLRGAIESTLGDHPWLAPLAESAGDEAVRE